LPIISATARRRYRGGARPVSRAAEAAAASLRERQPQFLQAGFGARRRIAGHPDLRDVRPQSSQLLRHAGAALGPQQSVDRQQHGRALGRGDEGQIEDDRDLAHRRDLGAAAGDQFRHLLEQQRRVFRVGAAGVGDEPDAAGDAAQRHHAGDDDRPMTWREHAVLQEAVGGRLGHLHAPEQVAVALGELARGCRFDQVAGLLQHPDIAGDLQGERAGRHRQGTRGQIAGSRGPGHAVQFLLQCLVARVHIDAKLRGELPLVAGHGEKLFGWAVLILAAAGAADLLARAVEDAADPLGDGGQRADRVVDQVPCASERRLASLDRRLLERVGLLHRLELRDRRDLADKPAQPGVAGRDEGAIVGRDRIAVHVGERRDGRTERIMRSVQQIGRGGDRIGRPDFRLLIPIRLRRRPR
jgi:hypothetical protein